jgi:hypothetical protein
MEQLIKTRQASDFAAAVDARIEAATSSVVQPLDATLTALAAITTTADKLIYATGADAFSTTTLTAAARDLLDDVDASAMRTTLGLGTMATAAAADYLPLAGGTMTGNLTISGASLFVGGSYAIAIGDAGNGYYGGWMANTYLALSPNTVFGWNSGDGTTVKDLVLARDAADALALRRSTNAQTFRVYGTYTDGSNYVRASLAATSAAVTLAAETAGTGADNIDLNLVPAGTGNVSIGVSGAALRTVTASTQLYLLNDLFLFDNGDGARIWLQTLQNNNGPIHIKSAGYDGLKVLNTGGVTIDNAASPDTVATLKLNARGTQLAPLFNAGGFTVNGTGTFVTFGHQNSASYPALKRSSTELQVRLADDSGYAPFRTGTLSIDSGNNLLVPYGEVQFNGASWIFDTAYQMRAAPYARIQWVPGGNWFGTQDAELGRAGVGTLGIWNKDNLGCALKVHGTYTDGSNFVRASLAATSTAVTLAAETAGTGADNVNVYVNPAGTGQVYIGSGGNHGLNSGAITISGGPQLSFNGTYLSSTHGIATAVYFLCTSGGGVRFDPAAYGGDMGIYRSDSGVLEINNGTAGQFRDLKLRTLYGVGGTVTSSAPVIDVTQTWNDGNVAFTAIKANITNSGSAWQSKLIDLQLDGTSAFKVTGNGNAGQTEMRVSRANMDLLWINGSSLYTGLKLAYNGSIGFADGYQFPDSWMHRDGTGAVALRNEGTTQAFRIYHTTDASNTNPSSGNPSHSNYQRMSLSCSASAVTLAAETAGTGADNVDVNITPAGTGSVNLGSKAKIGTATLSHDGLATLSIDSVIAQNATHFTFYANRAGAGTWAGMDGFAVRDSSFYAFSNSGQWYGTIDLALARNAAGIAEINNGTPGQFRDLKLRTLYGEGGTVTASAPVLDISQTWNNAAVAFQGARIKITNNASLPSPYGYTHGSMPFVITDGSDNVMSGFGRDGGLWFGGSGYGQSRLYKTGSFGVTVLDCSPFGGGNGGFEVFGGNDHQVGALINPLATYPTTGFSFGLSNRQGLAANGAQQFWYNDGTIHQRNGNVAQTYYIYGAYTDASNYVRASLAATSTSVTLAAQTAGTGADDVNLVLSTAGTGYVSITQSSNVGLALKLAGINYGGGNSPNTIFLIDGYSTSPVTTTNALFSVSGAGHVGIDTSWFNTNQYVANSLTINGVYGFRVAADLSTFGIHSDYGGNNLQQILIYRQSGNMALMSGGGILGIGGLTSSFPALKRSSTELQVRLADDSGYAPLQASKFNVDTVIGGTYSGFYIDDTHCFGVHPSNGRPTVVANGVEVATFHESYYGMYLHSGKGLSFVDGAYNGIFGISDNVLGVRNGTNAQKFCVYGTYTDASNYVRASLSASSTTVTLAAETAGTGADNVDVYVTPAGSGLVQLGAGATKVTVDNGGRLVAKNGTYNDPSILMGSSGAGWATYTGAAMVVRYDGQYGPVFYPINNSSGGIGLCADNILYWAVSYDPNIIHKDTGLARSAAGVIEVNNGTLGAYRDLALRTLLLRSTAAPGAPVNGDLWLDTAQKTLSYYAAGVAQTVNGVLFTQTQTVTVANTVTETALTGTGTGTLTLPANFFAAGKTIKIRALGYHSSTGSPNITIRVKLGSTTILTTGAITSGNGSDDAWVCDAFFTCRTTGGTGTVIGQGYYEEVHGTGNRGGMVNTATTTIDTTASQAISITVEWGTADAGNTISCTNVLIEVLN